MLQLNIAVLVCCILLVAGQKNEEDMRGLYQKLAELLESRRQMSNRESESQVGNKEAAKPSRQDNWFGESGASLTRNTEREKIMERLDWWNRLNDAARNNWNEWSEKTTARPTANGDEAQKRALMERLLTSAMSRSQSNPREDAVNNDDWSSQNERQAGRNNQDWSNSERSQLLQRLLGSFNGNRQESDSDRSDFMSRQNNGQGRNRQNGRGSDKFGFLARLFNGGNNGNFNMRNFLDQAVSMVGMEAQVKQLLQSSNFGGFSMFNKS